MNIGTVMEQLLREAEYGQRSLSRDLLIETYGKAKMAFQLEAITHDEFMRINHMTTYFINTHTQQLFNSII